MWTLFMKQNLRLRLVHEFILLNKYFVLAVMFSFNQSHSNKVMWWTLFMKQNLIFRLVWTVLKCFGLV
jgi:hypothetical protein